MMPQDFNQISRQTETLNLEDQAKNSGLLRLDEVGKRGRGPAEDWVPGDRGYIWGSGAGLGGGQWMIYLGDQVFWGFGAGDPHANDNTRDKVQCIDCWFDDEGAGAFDPGLRYYPGVGLMK